jgi:hypothetical protein
VEGGKGIREKGKGKREELGQKGEGGRSKKGMLTPIL